MSERPPVSLESLDSKGNGVRVEFRWIGDRYGHTILGIRGGSATPVLLATQSEESPAFTELHQQTDVFLLTGANSVGHWSLSVQRGTPGEGVAFDCACRPRAQRDQLEIAYQGCPELVEIANLEPATQMQAKANSLTIIARAPSTARLTFRWRYAVRLTPE